MPRFTGVYRAENGSRYCKATLGRDPLTAKRLQVTKRGFPTAADAAAARRTLLEEAEAGERPVTAGRSLTVDELLDLYLDGIDADGRLAAKTAATATENWPAMASTVTLHVDDPFRDEKQTVPLTSRFATWSVLDHDAVKSSFEPPGRKTPISDHLYSYFDEVLRPQLRLTEDQFASLFDEWEYLLGVVTADSRGRGPIGRFAWKSHGFGRTPDRALTAAASSLLAVGLFEGSAEKLEAVRTQYDELVGKSGLWF